MVITLICKKKTLIYGHPSIKVKTSFPNGDRYRGVVLP